MPKSRKRKLNRDASDEVEPATAIRVDRRAAVRLGTFNLQGDFFTPEGVIVRRVNAEVTPNESAKLVKDGARVAFEGGGCGGGGSGCTPSWPSAQEVTAAVAVGTPRFTDEYGSPTWIDVWEGEDEVVVFLHGDVRWGSIAG
ncbi:hypothetical protein ACLQ2Q_15810 [Microbacterium sp. DT81.1]|uniref:hypothetical protein n=1 Tax=Microbacterium sp. DT81.1 TaxID=3393413 RepID=UPI003CEEDA8F